MNLSPLVSARFQWEQLLGFIGFFVQVDWAPTSKICSDFLFTPSYSNNFSASAVWISLSVRRSSSVWISCIIGIAWLQPVSYVHMISPSRVLTSVLPVKLLHHLVHSDMQILTDPKITPLCLLMLNKMKKRSKLIQHLVRLLWPLVFGPRLRRPSVLFVWCHEQRGAQQSWSEQPADPGLTWQQLLMLNTRIKVSLGKNK